jgi:hypothetical protein
MIDPLFRLRLWLLALSLWVLVWWGWLMRIVGSE